MIYKNAAYSTATAIGTTISGAFAIAYLQAKIKELPTEQSYNAENYQWQLDNMTLNVTSIMLSFMRYYFPTAFDRREPPAAIVGGIPLGTVEELSHSVSDLLTHYRATGGVFLAHQPGGHQSLRIIGKAWGPNRYVFLTMLDWLFEYGKTEVKDYYEDSLLSGAKNISSIPLNTDPWKHIRSIAMDEGKEEYRLTLPVITRNKVYVNMHIETYNWSESVEEGLDVINFTLFFRKFTPEPPKQYSKVIDDFGDVHYFYRQDYDDQIYKKLQMMDIGLEMGYTASVLMYRAFQYTKPEERLVSWVCVNLAKQKNGDGSLDLFLQSVFPDSTKDVSADLTLNDKETLMQVA